MRLLRHRAVCLVFSLTVLSVSNQTFDQDFTVDIPAFPGAEGFGAYTTGGRGGAVLEVTNLNDDGQGSLRAGIETTGPRTIVFRVSGTIKLESKLVIREGDLTIAGQTAPGDGICIRDYKLSVKANNVIIRFLRIRLGDESGLGSEGDAAGGTNCRNIILDHCSMSWSIDECCSFYKNENTTIQWCIVSESLYDASHQKGPHGYGGIWGGKGATFHHNLIAHHSSRLPRLSGSRSHGDPGEELVDYRYNVIYNWGFNNIYGGEGGKHNIVANYYKAGPATSKAKRQYRIFNPLEPYGTYYIADNFVAGYLDASKDNWKYGVQGPDEDTKKIIKAAHPYPVPQITPTTPQQALADVIVKAGAVFPRRDTVDKRVIADVINGTAEYGETYGGGSVGIINSQSAVGGWPELLTYDIPTDTDHDGMPDDWEISQGLNSEDPEDRNGYVQDEKYSNLERYLNNLVADDI